MERYQSQATAHAVAILRNRQDAEDAVQDAFLNAYRALDRFDQACRFYPWFYTILRNCCLKLVTHRSPRNIAAEGFQILAATYQGPDDTLRLEAALHSLTPESREIVTLRHLNNLFLNQKRRQYTVDIWPVLKPQITLRFSR